jgi:hypothetical protein
MNDSRPTWEEWVAGAAEMAWPSRTPNGLVACSFQVDPQHKHVTVVFHVDAELSDEEHDDLSDVEGGILAHLPDDWQTRIEFENMTQGDTPHLLASAVIYRRGDVQTPSERWLSKRSLT